MTAPAPLPSPDRLNAGGAYVVRVRERRLLHLDAPWAEDASGLEEYMASSILLGLRVTCEVETAGTVTPDGSLSVEPEPWAARHYRRAVMRGAGVYRWGLWAMLAPGRAAAEPDAQAGAALGGHRREHIAGAALVLNAGRVFDYWAERGHAPPPPTAEALLKMSHPCIRRVYGPRVAHLALDAVRVTAQRLAQATTPTAFIEAIGAALAAACPDPATGSAGFLLGAAQSLAHRAAALLLPQGREYREQRRAFWAAVRGVVRVLRRMLPRVRRPRSTRPAPRPLYSRAIPPAAPLAPPALA